MFRRLANSWELVKASWGVLQADKELIIFPIVSACAMLIILISFAVPMFAAGLFEGILGGATAAPFQFLGYALLFLFYLTQYFVIIFSNSALVGAAMIRLKGGDPTVADGYRIAFQNIGPILGFTLISATIGLVLRWLAQRGVLGRLVVTIIGLAWNLATYLVVPVLVVEGVGPIEAIKRSTGMLKNTWGEQIGGNISIGLIFGILIFSTIVVGVVVIAGLAFLTQSIVLIVPSTLIFVATILILSLISSTLSGIYSAAVYRFAAEGKTGDFFSQEQIENAFQPK
jgi:hypothetical protein